MATRTVGTIATCPTGNTHGGYYFIRLDTGGLINRHDWTSLPMPTEAVDQVQCLAWRAKANKILAFTNLCNEDLDVLYAGLGPDDDDNPIDNDSAATGVGAAGPTLANNDDSADDKDSNYDPDSDSIADKDHDGDDDDFNADMEHDDNSNDSSATGNNTANNDNPEAAFSPDDEPAI